MRNMKPLRFIQGKWNNKRYEVIETLGKGGVGQILKARSTEDNLIYAIKLSKDILSLNREYKFLHLCSDIEMVVKAYEIDDFEIHGEMFCFLVLEYIQGVNLKSYTDSKNMSATDALSLILIIIEALEGLHKKGYVLGDLKLENIMLDRGSRAVKIVDMGGVTKIGEGIKEYTPSYDRACWRRGLRRAEESYDYFAVLMLLIQILLKRRLEPNKQSINDIKGYIREARFIEEIKPPLIKLLDAEEISKNFIKEIKDLYYIVKNNKKYEIMRIRDKAINTFFIASIFMLIATTIIILK